MNNTTWEDPFNAYFCNHEHHDAYRNLLVSSLLVLTPFITASNVLLIVSLQKTKERGGSLSLTNRLFVALATVDLLIGMVTCPLAAYHFDESDYYCRQAVAKVISVTVLWCGLLITGSIIIVVMIALVRYRLIVSTNLAPVMQRVVMTTITVGALILLGAVHMMQVVAVTSRNKHLLVLSAKIVPFYKSIKFVLLLVIILLNTLLASFIRNHTASSRTASINSRTYERQLTLTVVLINTSLVVTWLPSLLLDTYVWFVVKGYVEMTDERFTGLLVVTHWFRVFFNINSAVNSCIYMLRCTKIRAYHKRLLEQLRSCILPIGSQGSSNEEITARETMM